jgi:type 1 glutamine amidotransferase
MSQTSKWFKFLVLVIVISSSTAFARQGRDPILMLIVAPDISSGDHTPVSSLQILDKELAESTMFQITTLPLTEGSSDLTALKSKMSQNRVIILDNIARSQLMDLGETLKSFVASGGGLVMIGHSQDAIDLFGSTHTSATAPDPVPSTSSAVWGDSSRLLPVRVSIQHGDNPIIKGMPSPWMHPPEQLGRLNLAGATNVSMLATASSLDSSERRTTEEPVMWVQKFGKGRVFGTEMGNDLEALRCVGFITTLKRATEWAAFGRVSQKIPSTFPSGNTMSERTDIQGGTGTEFLVQFHQTASSTLAAMRQYASSIGVKGVGLIAYFNGDNIGSWISEMAVVGTFKRDRAMDIY